VKVASELPTLIRRGFRVRGQVQGVGFRPYVYRLARELALSGRVWNDAGGVRIEIQGTSPAVAAFAARLPSDAPGLARIDRVETQLLDPAPNGSSFTIDVSVGGPASAAITPDIATCPDCLAELFDPGDRRYRYPFINCTQCGPRLTITDALPYDRPNTSMAGFSLCPACAVEYRDPTSRRFHAQPNACPICGPRLALLAPDGTPQTDDDPVAATVHALQAGQIVAIKGLGGFHLACDARAGAAVARLRERKAREEKPFAVLVANVASLEGMADVDGVARGVLESVERPIVLLPKASGCDAALPGVAPGIRWLGALLPYTPLHWLLFHEAAGRPSDPSWCVEPQPLVLVLTSANPGGEPLVIDDREALLRLDGIADRLLGHDRAIRVRCDDSVVRIRGGAPAFLRRARGFVPQAIRLPGAGPSVLAVGAHLKNSVCLTRGDEAFLSPHIGDLDNPATCRALDETVAHLCDVLEIRPQRVVRDLHPDFYASRFAARYADEHGLQCLAVQHHHAHIAAVMAENGLRGTCLGVALDGVGLGDDGAAWGGELLRVADDGWQRLGHLRPLLLPGGDVAAREPWRMAAAALHDLGRGGEIVARYPGAAGQALQRMLDTATRCPPSSGAGRYFDAAAGLLGISSTASYEGQAAMLLEGLAASAWPCAPDPDGYRVGEDGVLDLRPALAALADAADDLAAAAARFHATLATALIDWVDTSGRLTGLRRVVLGGGCFLNELLTTCLSDGLMARGYTVHEARRAPPGDGGLALGQAWVALQRAATGGE